MLGNINIVMVETTHPGNIGAAARAMKNMGLTRLALVQPHHFPHPEATARAVGADDLLALAQVYPSLDAALAQCRLVIGASARPRSIAWPMVEPREAARLTIAQAREGGVAILFGREHSGLSNEELDRCHYLLHIPANPDFSSLNIAAAVQVVTYELYLAAREGAVQTPEEVWVGAHEMEQLYAHLESTLIDIAFLDPRSPRNLMRRLRRLFNRARLDQHEYNILRGVLTAVGVARRGAPYLPPLPEPGKLREPS